MSSIRPVCFRWVNPNLALTTEAFRNLRKGWPSFGDSAQSQADEPQQTLFSWAEFMAEEPVKPKRRGRKPQPASMSMFEWAAELEREKDTVGVGR